MKKLLSILLVVAAMLSVLSVGASAAQVMEGSASSTITFRQPSTYCILIPETLTENETGMYQLTAENINITADERIYVCVANADENGRILFTHENGEYTLKKGFEIRNKNGYSPNYTLPENCVGVFEGEDTSSKIYFMLENGEYECEKAYAGMYSATVEFNVSLGG